MGSSERTLKGWRRSERIEGSDTTGGSGDEMWNMRWDFMIIFMMVLGWEGSTPRPQGGMGEWQLSVSWGIRKIRDQTIKTLNITNKNPFYLNFIVWLVIMITIDSRDGRWCCRWWSKGCTGGQLLVDGSSLRKIKR